MKNKFEEIAEIVRSLAKEHLTSANETPQRRQSKFSPEQQKANVEAWLKRTSRK